VETKIIEGLNRLRENSLVSHLPQLIELGHVAKKLEDPTSKLKPLEIISLISSGFVGHPDLGTLSKKFQARFNINLLNKNITSKDIETIVQNQDFISLIHFGLLYPEYPFKLTSDTLLIQELKRCYLSHHDLVAEIGCGDGFFGYLLSWIFQPSFYSFNEIDRRCKTDIDRRITNCDSIPNFTKMEFILGTNEDSKLSKTYNKIIIRNTFHHFSKKNEMLQSIRHHLNENGTLIIIEAFNNKGIEYANEYVPGDYQCTKKMKRKKFDQYLSANGFELIDTFQAGARTVMRFKKVK
jgi:SAM-dependent methyltransferase